MRIDICVQVNGCLSVATLISMDFLWCFKPTYAIMMTKMVVMMIKMMTTMMTMMMRMTTMLILTMKKWCHGASIDRWFGRYAGSGGALRIANTHHLHNHNSSHDYVQGLSMLRIANTHHHCHPYKNPQARGHNDYDYGEQALSISISMLRELLILKKTMTLVKGFLVLRLEIGQ